MSDTEANPPRTVHGAVKGLVLFHLFCITVWSLPTPPDSLLNGTSKPVGSDSFLIWNQKTLKTWLPLNIYLSVTGFWQYWDMFAPNPASTDFWADGEVVYKDGTKRHYQYPRMALLSIPEKFVKERYRKFYERANADNYSYLWPQFGLRIAYENDNPQNPPVRVIMKRHWRPIAAPGEKQAEKYNEFVYFEYEVDQEALKKMREGR